MTTIDYAEFAIDALGAALTGRRDVHFQYHARNAATVHHAVDGVWDLNGGIRASVHVDDNVYMIEFYALADRYGVVGTARVDASLGEDATAALIRTTLRTIARKGGS